MHFDLYGQPTSLNTAQAREDWDACLQAFLAHSARTPEHLGAVLRAEPGFALGHAVKGMFYILLGRRELMETARCALKDAKSALAQGSITPREAQFVSALEVWLAGSPTGAIAHLEAVLDDHPADTLAMKLSHAIRFVLGDSKGMRASVERVLPSHGPDHAGRGYILGCHAFGLEETGAYEQARATAQAGLILAPDDAWGLHAVAHVFDMTANARGGLDWLQGREAAWAHCNNFRYHVWWHKALMHLDLGEVDEVFALYDTQIRADKTDDYRDISNATALLSRLELDGVAVGDRWEELAELSAARTEDACVVFADLHYLLGLMGGHRRDAIHRLIGRMERTAASPVNEMDQITADPGLAAAAGLEAFGEGHYETAFKNLAKARPNMQMIGGSHAQRDVFERLTIDAGIRAGYLSDAERMLAERTRQRAGREDGYTAARLSLISAGRDAARQPPLEAAE